MPTAVPAQGNTTHVQILFIVPDVFANFYFFVTLQIACCVGAKGVAQ